MAVGCCQACGHQGGLKPAWPTQPAGPQLLLGQDAPACTMRLTPFEVPPFPWGPKSPPSPLRGQPVAHSALQTGSGPCALLFLLRSPPTPPTAFTSLPWSMPQFPLGSGRNHTQTLPKRGTCSIRLVICSQSLFCWLGAVGHGQPWALLARLGPALLCLGEY